MKNFYNDRQSIVSDAIDGLIASSGGKLQRFNPDSHARVVVRADWDKSKVAIISGGGSGHEPAHAGLIGPGLLTAAVCGDVYASPSVDAVLSAILQVTGPSGCLLVIKNYTGDRLNFGLAAEKAKALGHQVEVVVVGDDIAIADAAQPRGIAGTVFVHKVAGFLSEKGESLAVVLNAASAVAGDIKTLGLSRDTCTVPGSEKQTRIAENEVEVGLGIHGEPGVEVKEFANCTELMQVFTQRLSLHIDKSKRHIALFNNLGGLNGIECSILFKEFMASDLANVVDVTIGPVAIMTALDMPGFSISLLPLEPFYKDALLSDIECAAWPQMNSVTKLESINPPALEGSPSFTASNDPAVRAVIETIIESCLSSESELNELDAKVGDGDTGTTFAAAARTLQGELDSLPMADGAQLFAALSDMKSRQMGGSSGVLFAILFANAAEAYKQSADWGKALSAGLDAMQKYGGAGVGDRTMIDALKPALDAIVAGAGIDEAAQQARKGATATSKMLSANAGRSAYLEARSLEGHTDPGAEGIARMFEAVALNNK
jgi:dihydroxyacetone kinase